jgi:hypothetical protein
MKSCPDNYPTCRRAESEGVWCKGACESVPPPIDWNQPCADCAGFDVEWMHHCRTHRGVIYCRGCECPYCAEDMDSDDDYPDQDYP